MNKRERFSECHRCPNIVDEEEWFRDHGSCSKEGLRPIISHLPIRLCRECYELWYQRYRRHKLEKLIGREQFRLLDRESQGFLMKTAGIFDFGVPIDIRKVLRY